MGTSDVTALFADISGFTALADRLDEDALHEVLSPVIRDLAAVAESHGGYIAKYAGDALLVFFGVPEARDDDAERACRVALAMHARLAELTRDLPADVGELSMHIGVDTGLLIEGAGDDTATGAILGGPVAGAQRLESSAGSHETFISEATRRRLDDSFVLTDLGEITPKGGGPIHAWHLTRWDGVLDLRRREAAARALASVIDAVGRAGVHGTVEERRLVTALFADFTGVADVPLPPAELDDVLARLVERLSAVAVPYEAHVARYARDAIFVFFGAPVAHEDDPARALLTALAMHREFEAARAELSPEAAGLGLHIGVNSGHVVSGAFGGEVRADYSILGDTVNLAQRLESVAPAGETYVGETTYALTRDTFELEPVGALTLKGKAGPVPGWRVVARRQRPLAPTQAGRGGIPFVGREAEVAAAVALLDRLTEGRGGIVSVAGEAGVGKSRLTTEIARAAGERGVTWFVARCISFGAGLPYWPFADLMRRSFGIRFEDAPDEAADRLRRGVAALGLESTFDFVARLLGLDAGDVGSLEPEAFQHGLHRALGAVIERLAMDAPLVLVLEDVHWVDHATASLVTDLARRSAAHPILLYLTTRPEGAATVTALGATTEHHAAIMLKPLGTAAIGQVVEAVLEGRPPPGFVTTVMRRTGGNPFFVQELVRSLVDGEILSRGDDGHWRLRGDWSDEAVPTTVEGVLASRIDLLPRPVAQLLQTASVIGRQVRLGLLRAIVDDDVDVDGPVQTLVELGFFDPVVEADGEPAALFHHALTQEVAYSRLLRRNREQLHLLAAERAEQLYGSGDEIVDLLARHYHLGRAGPKALDYLVRAGERARRLFANDEAVRHLSAAAAVAREHEEVAGRLPELLLTIADLHGLTGRYDDAFDLYREVRDVYGMARGWSGMAAILRSRGEHEPAVALASEALASSGLAPHEEAGLWLERGWSEVTLGRYQDGEHSFHRGLSAAGADPSRVRGNLLVQLARLESEMGRPAEALEHATDARGIFEGLDDAHGLATADRVIGHAFIDMERFDEAVVALRRGLGTAQRTGDVAEIGGCLINLGFVEATLANYDDAIDVTRRAVDEFERIGHELGRAIGYGNLADFHHRRGTPEDLSAALDYCDIALALGEETGFKGTVADVSIVRASIHLRRDELPSAVEWAERAATALTEMGSPARAADAYQLLATARRRRGENHLAEEAEARAATLLP